MEIWRLNWIVLYFPVFLHIYNIILFLSFILMLNCFTYHRKRVPGYRSIEYTLTEALFAISNAFYLEHKSLNKRQRLEYTPGFIHTRKNKVIQGFTISKYLQLTSALVLNPLGKLISV